MSLKEWFGKGKKGDWVDIGAPKKKGKYQACGRKSAVQRKRAAGNPGGKPTNVKTILKKKGKK